MKNGFTLIELVIVAAIIGILATAIIAVLDPFNQFQKASDAKRKSDLSQVQKALETYYQDKGRYPANTSDYKIQDASLGIINWGSNWGAYMNVVPQDPSSGHAYVYYSNGQSYYIYANLSRGGKDPQACNGGGACSSLSVNGIPSSSCGAVCNFGVSSPDVSP